MMMSWLYFDTAQIICVLDMAERSHYELLMFCTFFISLHNEIQHLFLWLTVINLSCMIINFFQLADRININEMPMVIHSFIYSCGRLFFTLIFNSLHSLYLEFRFTKFYVREEHILSTISYSCSPLCKNNLVFEY